jgi:type IV pilus assembly protein PilF
VNMSPNLCNRSVRFLSVVVLCHLLAACVSTTSGQAESKPDIGEAASLNHQLAVQYYQNGKFELARDRLIYSTELDPDRPAVWSLLATTYEQLGNPRLAEESHNQALRVGAKNFDVQNSYAIFLCGQERYDEAEVQFERSIGASKNDNSELMMTNAGVCMTQKPDYAKAESFFRRAIEQRPDYGEALLQMALLKHQTGDNLSARAFLQRYRGLNTDTAGVLYLCVLIETSLGVEKARDQCANELVKLFPSSPEAGIVLRD